VMADLSVIELVTAEDEAMRPDIAHQREHGQECWPVVFRKM
jgi:hypothetical protein